MPYSYITIFFLTGVVNVLGMPGVVLFRCTLYRKVHCGVYSVTKGIRLSDNLSCVGEEKKKKKGSARVNAKERYFTPHATGE